MLIWKNVNPGACAVKEGYQMLTAGETNINSQDKQLWHMM
jgi:hypothetical protein